MQINVADYEKLGAFYLGREYDVRTKEMAEKLVMYNSKDLVTHGVVLGMTGSGKTGLCLALLEEAALDGIPAIVIDPKGDIANFLLTFPNLSGEDFQPWVNEEDAQKKGKTVEEFAASQAEMWKNGLAEWGQTGERIAAMREKVAITVYTPGSNAGIPVSILSSMQAPEFEVLDDAELLGDRVESTVSSLLGLVGVDADPIKSPEHIMLSNIMTFCWRKNENLDLAKIIEYTQNPPFEKIGAVAVDDFFPPKKRNELAMSINGLLASPGFASWMMGEPLDIKKMLRTPEGKPRVAIYSISHLSDSERMFFVSLLLNQTVGWMRSQSGTTSLRALLYMDEIYGYLPPTQNPPSKKPMMILLKQARAFGVGVLLATQNPVDLDYKALSNIGTWWLGRLQTERDKNRVLDGLEGASIAQNAKFDRGEIEKLLSALGNRIFLMNNTHDDGPCIFQVRWVLSYLRGPLTRSQIKSLMDPQRGDYSLPTEVTAVKVPTKADAPKPQPERPATSPQDASGRPDVPTSVDEFFFPITKKGEGAVVYMPTVMRAAEITFTDAAKDVFTKRKAALLNKLTDELITIDADKATHLVLDAATLGREPVAEVAAWMPLPDFARQSKTYTTARDTSIEWIYKNETLDLLCCEVLGVYAKPEESEADFRARIDHKMREERDEAMEDMKRKYEPKFVKIENAIEAAHVRLDKERAESRSAKMGTAVSIGQSILGVLFGKRGSSSVVTRGGTAARGASKAYKESSDVRTAEEKLAAAHEELAALEQEAAGEMEKIKARFDSAALTTVSIRPLKKNITMVASGLAWLPYFQTTHGIEQAW